MTSPGRVASLSLDLDDLWTYLRTRGDPSWEEYPSYLQVFVPRILDQLAHLGLHLTVFMVGIDATRPANIPLLRAFAERGHEIANHSFSHECWMQLHSRQRIVDELARTEAAVEAATGRRPIGFRGPGFSWSSDLLQVLAERGYRYDASTLPTFLGPVARMYFLATAPRLSPAERARRRGLFGPASAGLQPAGAYRWRLGEGRTLLEIPTTTIPGVRLPFHMSYLLYLRGMSRRLMVAYLRAALAACRAARIQPSFLLHPLDLLEAGDAPRLSFFPGMRLNVKVKRDAFVEALRMLSDEFEIVTMAAHAERLMAGPLAERTPPQAAVAVDARVSASGGDTPQRSRLDHASAP
jgi:hypothetical protein